MLFFGHAGITLGIATAAANLPPFRERLNAWSRPKGTKPGGVPVTTAKPSPFDALASFVDIRLLLIGSLLPDIIDKPLGHLIFRQALSNGRTYAHTLLFSLVIAGIGAWLYSRSRRTWILVLSFGSLVHLILDEMWLNPHTLFWPVFGFAFQKTDISDWIPAMLHSLAVNPVEYVSEGLGFVLVAWLAYVVLRRRRFWSFLKHGRIGARAQ